MYVGIDIGGTSVRVAAFNDADSSKIEQQERFAVSGDYTEDVGRLAAAIKAVVGGEAPAGIGIGIAGSVDSERGMLIRTANLPEWADRPLRDDLAKEFDCPIGLINDAEAAAWAEARHAGHADDFWFVTWGTGIGGSIVEQHPDGPYVVAAEPGHHVLRWDEDSPQCNCGRRGCLEAYVGGAYFERRFGKSADALGDTEWADIVDWFARGLYNLVRVRPVDEIVIGGGVATKQPGHLPDIERKTNEYLDGFRTVRVTAAKHGEDAGMVGALAALRQS